MDFIKFHGGHTLHFLDKKAGAIIIDKTLKGQCHEDFAVSGQFCAKIITLRL